MQQKRAQIYFVFYFLIWANDFSIRMGTLFFCGGIERNTLTESDQKIEIAVSSIQETPLKFILNKKITLK